MGARARAAVIGTGSWGTVLAALLAGNGHRVTLWARTAAEARDLAARRENRRLLPGFRLPDGVQVEHDPARALAGAALAVFAVPAQRLRENARALREHLPPDAVLVSASKGIELGSHRRPTEVLREELGADRPACALSGPNLAREIAEGLPATSVAACQDEAAAEAVRAAFMSPRFRVYTNTDVTGVELAGALKNVIALGAGMGDGFGYGDNAKAAFITRGLAEMSRLGVAAGANPLTFAGLAGLGDLAATCYSRHSRNRYVGEQLARGRPLDEIAAGMAHVAEGVTTTIGARELARELGVEMPITEGMFRVLFEGLDPHRAVEELMGRAPTHELRGITEARGG
ncbi:MAG TPA: NAD(P)H-dependent glycerol-3-phosphate dehydrogenase [Dehalococcoidia bacterium]